MKRHTMATIETRMKICGEWEAWHTTTDGEVRLDTALDIARARAALVRGDLKQYRVMSEGREVWPTLAKAPRKVTRYQVRACGRGSRRLYSKADAVKIVARLERRGVDSYAAPLRVMLL